MAKNKKFLLHRITEEDAGYIAEETYTPFAQIQDKNCYCLINKDTGKIFRENDKLLLYKATGYNEEIRNITNNKKRRFLEAVEACAYFRGYANMHDIKFKNPNIAELLYKIEDHEIEVPNACETSCIVTGSMTNETFSTYITEMSEAYDHFFKLQRDFPVASLFIVESEKIVFGNHPVITNGPAENIEQVPFNEEEEMDDFDELDDLDYDDF